MPIPSTPSYTQIPNNLSDLLKIGNNNSKVLKGSYDSLKKGLTNITKITNLTKKRVTNLDKLYKSFNKRIAEIKDLKKFAKDSKKITDLLKKGKFKQVNPNLGNAVGFALNLASIGLSLMTINHVGRLQATQLRNEGIISSDLSKTHTQAIANAIRLSSLREDLKKFTQRYDDDKGRLLNQVQESFTNSVEGRELSKVAKKQANDALYEAREGRKKLDTKLSNIVNDFNQLQAEISSQNAELARRSNDAYNIGQDAYKIGNDALYEVRNGRSILEGKVSNLQNKLASIDPRVNLNNLSNRLSQLDGKTSKALNTANKALQFKAQPGPQGRPGRDGKPGINGKPGLQGRPGRDGLPGINGRPGRDGLPGINGRPGRDGLPGINGKPGLAGRPGIDGKPGKNGIDGKPGRDGKDVDMNRYNDLIAKISLIPPLIARVPGDTVKQMPKPLSGPQIEAAASAGVCRSTRAGGCMSNALGNTANTINQNTNAWGRNLLNKFNAGANAAQLALLKKVDLKLGAQIAGGLTGAVKNIFENKLVDRALQVANLATSTHNALMLSNNLFETLFSATDNLLDTVGMKIKDEKGAEIGIKQVVDSLFLNFANTLFGADNVKSMNIVFKKANRIYQSSQNILNNVISMFNSMYGGLEVIGNRISRIGNALRWFGVLSEKAFGWMNENNAFSNPIITRITKVTEAADALEQVSSEVLSISDNAKDLIKNTKDIKKELNDLSKEETKKEDKERSSLKIPDIKDIDVA